MTDAVGRRVEELDTPALLVDLDVAQRNIARWQREVTARGKKLRPHVKTHKIPELAQWQLDAGAAGIAAAKVSEAEPFAAAGADDIVIAYPIVLEIDTGMHRVGYEPARFEEIEALARLVRSLPGIELEGVTTFRNVFFDGAERMTKEEAGRDEGRILVELAERLRARGIEIREVSAGGTISGLGVAEVDGVTEVRAGTYVFSDWMQVEYGTATWDDVALSILCTVVSRTRDGRATIDGGAKTFSGDRPGAEGLARAADVDAVVDRMTEEHGMVRLGEGVRPEVGQKLRFFPVHVCTCVNLSDELFGVRGGRVEKVWRVEARGKRT